MALDSKAEAALALNRFGVGPRPGSIAAIASDPRGALIAELDRPGAGRIANTDLLASGDAARAAFEFQRVQRLARQAERAALAKEASGQRGAPDTRPEPGSSTRAAGGAGKAETLAQ